jgi:Uncharacterized protein conserved in bacteria
LRRSVLHIIQRSDWEAARAAGAYRADSLATEGFIHCSTPEQVLTPANALFRDVRGLVLLVLDENKIAAPVVYEDCYESGTAFPHVYGPINLDAVTDVLPFEPEADGTFRLPDALTMP